MKLFITPKEIIAASVLIIFSVLYIFISPATTSPDEVAHLAYPRHILIESEIPSFKSAQDTWESHQPPLYYLSTLPFVVSMQQLPIEKQLQMNRFASVAYLVIALILAGALLYFLFPQDPLLRSIGLLFLGFPMSLYIFGSFSNDATLIPSALALFLLYYKKESFKTLWHWLLVGAIFGIILLTKIHIYPYLGVLGIAMLWKKNVKNWIAVSMGALVTSGWWFAHNIISVGDVFGLKHTFLLWENQTETGTLLELSKKIVQGLVAGFIGIFGKFNITLPWYVYLPLAAFFLALLIASILLLRRDEKIRIVLLATSLTLLFVIYQNFHFFQPQGRYLLSLAPFFMLLGTELLRMVKSSFHKRFFFLLLLILIVSINTLSLVYIYQYYSKHPITNFETRSVNLLHDRWIGTYSFDQATEGDRARLRLDPGSEIFTLQDLRIPTQDKPYLQIQSDQNSESRLDIYWKTLGQHTFLEERKVSIVVQGETDVFFPENSNTLLQDVKIKSSEDNAEAVHFTTLNISTK